jgi:hypothetical protein
MAAVAAVPLALAGCAGDGARGDQFAAVDLAPGDIKSVTFVAAGKTARFLGTGDGSFDADSGATAESATLLSAGAADRMFPLNAYRILSGVDGTNPDYGLVSATAKPGSRPIACGEGCSLEVVSSSGAAWRLVVGGPSFNGAGFYATVDGDSRVFLLIAQTVGDIISFATGVPFEFPPTARTARADQVIKTIGTDSEDTSNSANDHPFLRQALAARADEQASKKGKVGDNLVKAATSTEGQAGADK